MALCPYKLIVINLDLIFLRPVRVGREYLLYLDLPATSIVKYMFINLYC